MISLLAVSHVSQAEAGFWIGFLVVVLLIGAAAWCFFRNLVVPGVCLAVLAVVAGVLLL